MNLARATVYRLERQTREDLVAVGSLHGVSLLSEPFGYLASYARYVPPAQPSGIPVLDQPVKSGGSQNFNAKTYIQVSRDYLFDSMWVVRRRPAVYLASVRDAMALLMSPSTEYLFVLGNREKILAYDRFVNDLIYLRTESFRPIAAGILAAYLFAVGYGAVLLARVAKRRESTGPEDLTILFLAFTAAYTVAVSCLTEIGENQRMRFVLDPLVLAVVAVGLRADWLRIADVPSGAPAHPTRRSESAQLG